MNDNTVIQVLKGILDSGLLARLSTAIVTRQSYQPTQQGVPVEPSLFIHKINATRYGFPGNESAYNSVNDNFDTTERIWVTPTFQISALAQQDPTNLSLPTASDIVETAADIMQSAATQATLLQSNINIIRVESIPISYFINEKDRHEQEPSFEIELSYLREFTTTTPKVNDFRESGIFGV